MKVLIAVLAILVVGAPAIRADSCSDLLPRNLQQVLSRRFPSYRLPRENDNLAEDVEYVKRQGASGCLGVASADFNGDGRVDRAVLLSGETTLLIAALKYEKTWRIERVADLEDIARNRLYVAVAEPGKYERTQALDGPLEPRELSEFTAKKPGIVVGLIESAASAHFRIRPNYWRFVWISD